MATDSDRFLMAVLSRQMRKRSRKVEERIADRLSKGLCLNKKRVGIFSDETEDCPNKAGSLGVCSGCRSTFYRESAKGTPEEQLDYQNERFQLGLILWPGEIHKINSKSLLSRRRA